MSLKVTILESELLTSLGNYEDRVTHLKNGTNSIDTKTTNLIDEVYPYYSLDNETREPTKEMVLAYLYKVVDSIISKANMSDDEIKHCALFMGASSIDLSIALLLEKSLDPTYESTLECTRVGAGYYLEAIRKKFGFKSFSLTYNTACTSSANALLDASNLLKTKKIEYAIVLGLEIYNPTTIEGFVSMQLLSKTTLKSFDKDRDGIILGEAVGAILLSRDDIRDNSLYFLDGESTCETYSVSGANPDGVDMSKLMLRAMDKASINEEDITLIKAHGTASQINDTAEINAMKLAFKELPPFTSFKPYIGHTLGACALAELILLKESLDNNLIPKSLNFKEAQEGVDIEPIRKNLKINSGIFMLNYFGFGGNNTSLLIQKEPI